MKYKCDGFRSVEAEGIGTAAAIFYTEPEPDDDACTPEFPCHHCTRCDPPPRK
jgi:hypothetical protein